MNKTILDYLLGRATEASTYAGLGAALAGLHITLTSDVTQAIVGVCISVVSLLAVVLKDKGIA